jgi:hypothetical protein
LVKVLDNLCIQDPEFEEDRISQTQWKEIQQLVSFFKPFAEITIHMSGQFYSTIGSVIVLFNVIMDHLDKYREGLSGKSSKIKLAAKAAYDKIKCYYNKTNTIHCIVTLLDPRFHLQYFRENEFTDIMIKKIKKR